MRLFDRVCAGTIFVLAIVDCLLVPKDLHGQNLDLRDGPGFAFHRHVELLRIRNGCGVQGLKLFCITANVTMLMFVIALMVSIGKSRTLHNPQVPLLAALLLVETAFSLGKSA